MVANSGLMSKAPVDRKKLVRQPRSDYRYVHPLSIGFSRRNAIRGYNWREAGSYKYPGGAAYESWLAWEALRRNVLFQKYCDENDPAGESWVENPQPHHWGLAKFKHYAQPIVKTDEATWPDWTAARPADVIDFASPRERGGPRPTNVRRKPSGSEKLVFTLQGGQVAVVFDLEHTRHFRSLLDYQVEEAGKRLRAIVNMLQGGADFAAPVEKPRAESVIDLLRLADAMLVTPRPSPAAIVSTIFPGGRKLGTTASTKGRRTKALAPGNLWRKVASATSLIYRQGYLQLLLTD